MTTWTDEHGLVHETGVGNLFTICGLSIVEMVDVDVVPTSCFVCLVGVDVIKEFLDRQLPKAMGVPPEYLYGEDPAK